MSDLDKQKQAAQKQADAALTRTDVEAQRSAMNHAQMAAASGLTSGANAQARLALENQRQADLTAIRAQQQAVDAEVERQKGLLAQQYSAAFRQAQANNDMQRAQALLEAARADEAALLQKQQAAAQALAGAGDFSLFAQLYGLTDAQRGTLEKDFAAQQAPAASAGATADQVAAAKLMAAAGDFSLYQQLYGLTPAQVATLKRQWAEENGVKTPDPPKTDGATVATGALGLLGGLGTTLKDVVSGAVDTAKDAAAGTEPPVDEQSLAALGNPSVEKMLQMIQRGEVEMYVENGMTKFRKITQASAGSKKTPNAMVAFG